MITDIKKYMKIYRDKNKERIAKLNKIRYDKWIKKNKKYNVNYMKKYMKVWRKNNPNYLKQWRIDNIKEKAKYQEIYRIKNKKRLKEYDNKYRTNRYKIDLKFNLNCRISRTICLSLKGNKNGRHWETLVGYNLKDLFKRLKSTIPEGYTWQDFMQGKLHIDHIIPISVFNFTKSEHIDFKHCWALSNLRLLPAKENLRKQNKLYKPFQPALKFSFIS